MTDHAKELRLLAQQRWARQYEHDYFFLACAGEIERLTERLAEAEAENSRLVAANKARDEFLRGHRYKRSEVDQYIDLCESQIADWHKVADERSAEIVRLSARLAEAERNAERLKIRCETYTEAYGVALRATHQSHSGHWDEKGTHGANCPECIRAQEARDNCQAIIKRGLDRLIDAARATDSATPRENV